MGGGGADPQIFFSALCKYRFQISPPTPVQNSEYVPALNLQRFDFPKIVETLIFVDQTFLIEIHKSILSDFPLFSFYFRKTSVNWRFNK